MKGCLSRSPRVIPGGEGDAAPGDRCDGGGAAGLWSAHTGGTILVQLTGTPETGRVLSKTRDESPNQNLYY